MKVLFTSGFKEAVRKASLYFEEVDLYEGTELAKDFPLELDSVVKYISDFPEAFSTYKGGRSRYCTLNKFTSHYLLYDYNPSQKCIVLLDVRGYRQNF